MRRIGDRPQRTLLRPAVVCGRGLLTGVTVTVVFQPAPEHSGVVFVRKDLPGAPTIPAQIGSVTGTQRRTTLASGSGQVTLVEHLLAALAGLRIDNCRVDIDGPEPPGLDGSSLGFVQALCAAGIQCQSARRSLWTADRPATVRHDGATLSFHPSDEPVLKLSYFLDYGPDSPIGWQAYHHVATPGTMLDGLAGCRTFVLESEVEALRRQGIGIRATQADLVVFGKNGPIDNRLRFANEPARHKVLDMIGDLSLFGEELCGHVVAYRSGHPLNIELVRVLGEQMQGRAGLRKVRAA